MAFDNGAAKAELVKLLRQHGQALPLVGSGSSRFTGYPSWSQMLDELRHAVIPEQPFPDDLDLLQKASFIRRSLEGFECRFSKPFPLT